MPEAETAMIALFEWADDSASSFRLGGACREGLLLLAQSLHLTSVGGAAAPDRPARRTRLDAAGPQAVDTESTTMRC